MMGENKNLCKKHNLLTTYEKIPENRRKFRITNKSLAAFTKFFFSKRLATTPPFPSFF